jgi:hypothetical protein
MKKTILALALVALSSSAFGEEIAMDKSMVVAITAKIQAKGFNCPIAKLALKKPASAQGDVIQIWCGPTDREGVFDKFQYRVTFRPDDGVDVAEW